MYLADKFVYYMIGLFAYVPVLPIGGLEYFSAHPGAFYGPFAGAGVGGREAGHAVGGDDVTADEPLGGEEPAAEAPAAERFRDDAQPAARDLRRLGLASEDDARSMRLSGHVAVLSAPTAGAQ